MNRSEQLSGKKFEEQEWQKLFNKHQQEYVRARLEAIKHLQDGKVRQEVMNHIGCARQSLITWIDRYSSIFRTREQNYSRIYSYTCLFT